MIDTSRVLTLARMMRAMPVAVLMTIGSASAAEEQTINAFSVWSGEGAVYESGPHSGTFVGSISGMLFVQTDKGPTRGGFMICPATLEIDLVDATQRGQGKCTITGDDGAKIFADWSCQGVHMIGCDGELKLTGGSGRMTGITGAGSLTVRTTTRVISAEASVEGSLAEIGSGILILGDLVYTRPVQ